MVFFFVTNNRVNFGAIWRGRFYEHLTLGKPELPLSCVDSMVSKIETHKFNYKFSTSSHHI